MHNLIHNEATYLANRVDNVGLKLIASIFSCTNIKLFGNREVLFDPSSYLTVVWGCKILDTNAL